MARKNDVGVSGRTLNGNGTTTAARGREKAKSCKHSTGKVGELIVYAHPTCPLMSMIKGDIVSSILRCAKCEHWEERDGA